MSAPGSQANYHHTTACHCMCHHHTQAPQQSASSQYAGSAQPNIPGKSEISQLFNGIQEYFRSLYTPPQIRVSRTGFWSNQSMAFGRQSLASMTYDEAETLFRSIFESEDDKLKVPANGTAKGEKIRVIPPTMEIHATFLREPRGSTEESVMLHRTAWPEVVENVKAMSVVFRKARGDETSK